jgi:hypothetical protein
MSASDDFQNTVTLAVEKTVMKPLVDPEVTVPSKEWMRICRRVRKIGSEPQWVSNLGWGLAFLVPGSLLSWWQWEPAYEQLPATAQVKYAWVSPALFILSVACIVGVVLCFVLHRTMQRGIAQQKEHVVDLLDQISERFGIIVPSEETVGLIQQLRRVVTRPQSTPRTPKAPPQ